MINLFGMNTRGSRLDPQQHRQLCDDLAAIRTALDAASASMEAEKKMLDLLESIPHDALTKVAQLATLEAERVKREYFETTREGQDDEARRREMRGVLRGIELFAGIGRAQTARRDEIRSARDRLLEAESELERQLKE